MFFFFFPTGPNAKSFTAMNALAQSLGDLRLVYAAVKSDQCRINYASLAKKLNNLDCPKRCVCSV